MGNERKKVFERLLKKTQENALSSRDEFTLDSKSSFQKRLNSIKSKEMSENQYIQESKTKLIEDQEEDFNLEEEDSKYDIPVENIISNSSKRDNVSNNTQNLELNSNLFKRFIIYLFNLAV